MLHSDGDVVEGPRSGMRGSTGERKAGRPQRMEEEREGRSLQVV